MSRSLLVLAALLAGCGDKEDPVDDTGASAVPEICREAPVVTWESWGQGFLAERCQTCHATASEVRNDAPEEVSFDSFADVEAHRDRILARAAGEDASMPPEGGVSEDDQYLLEVWLTCWE